MEAAEDRGDVDVDGEGVEGEGEVGEKLPPAEPDFEPEPSAREPSVLDRIQDELDDVERALQRLDEGSYGSCQACGAAMADEVLAGRPTARFCAEHEAAPAS